jgi:ribosome recycling factor
MFTQFEAAVAKIQAHFKEDLSSIRTGRANPELLNDVLVLAYGTKTPLSQVASVTVSGARSLVVEPWDPKLLQDIEKALLSSTIGVTPVVESKQIRINLPEMTEERRLEFKKIVSEKLEQARVAIRKIREDTKKSIESRTKAGELTKDDREDSIKELNEKTKAESRALEDFGNKKEKEIMEL